MKYYRDVKLFPPRAAGAYWDFDFFFKSFRGNGMDFCVETWRAASLHKTEIQTGEKIAQSTGIPVGTNQL